MIYPQEFSENSLVENYHRHSVRSRAIYLLLVSILSGLFLLLPWIHVDIGVRSPGMIRAEIGRVEVFTPAAGQVEQIRVRAGSRIAAGDTLVLLDSREIQKELRYVKRRLEATKGYLTDLEALRGAASTVSFPDGATKGISIHGQADSEPSVPHATAYGRLELKTDRYRTSLEEFLQKLDQAEEEIQQAARESERNRLLLSGNLISRQQMEESLFSLDLSRHRLRLLNREQSARWSLDRQGFLEEKEELENQAAILSRRMSDYTLLSPVKGTIQKMPELHRGSFLGTDRILAEIIPESELIAEIYVRPADIGWIRTDMPVRMQIDTYPHNEWGFASGTVTAISADVDFVENRPIYKVLCSLERPFLELKDGYRGSFKNGMTLQAQFIVARRSLFQLLFDRVDDWLNPVWSPARDRAL